MPLLLLTAAALASAAGPAAAQAPLADAEPVVISGARGTCAGCRITLEKTVEMGDSAGPGRLDRALSSWARDSRGRFYVASGWDGPVRVFGADGSFLRTLGDSAAADTVRPVIGFVAVAAGDTVHLLDDLSSVHHVLDGALRPVRTTAISPHLRASAFSVLLPDGRIAFSGTVPTRDAIGYPLHLMDAAGSVAASLGSDEPALRPGGAPDVRRIARAGADALWSGELTRYAVERWTLDGRRTAAFVREAPWFAPYTSTRWTPAEPPHPMLMAVRQDAQGRLWTLVRVADPAWGQARPVMADSVLAARAPLLLYDLNDLYDAVVEVIDPACGTLLHAQRFPVLLGGFLDDEHLLEWHLSGAAPPRLGVWRAGHNLPERSNEPCRTSQD